MYKTILIQGAMDIEVEYLISKLSNIEKQEISGFQFYVGIINNLKIIVSKTHIGTINATMATSIGVIIFKVDSFKPDIVINQGIAGSHRPDIHIGDIIIGEKCCNINSYSMPQKIEGEGSNPFEWEPNKRAMDVKYADKDVLKDIKKYFEENNIRQTYVGILGSGDVFSREIDRINWINKKFNNLCEDMESIGTYSVCSSFNIPCIGIRIISNNEITGEELNKNQAVILQKLMIDYLNNIQ